MNGIRFGFVLLFLMVVRSSFVIASFGDFNQIGNAQIADEVILGNFLQINNGVVISRLSKVGSFTHIGSDTIVGENTCIGEHVEIDSDAKIERDVLILDFARIGHNDTLHKNVQVNSFATIGSDADIGSNSLISMHVNINNGINICIDVIVDQHAQIGNFVRIGERAYVGSFTHINDGQVIGSYAVIHRFVQLNDGVPILERQVIIAAPSTNVLINIMNENPSQCSMTNASSQVSDNVDDDSEFNSSIMNLMTQQWTELIRYCETSTNSNPITMSGLSCIVRQYLVGCYGKERLDQMQQPRYLNDMDQKELFETYHFGSNATKTILSTKAGIELIHLLAVHEDIQRGLRTIGDDQCQMIGDLKENRRDVVVKTPSIHSVVLSNANNVNIVRGNNNNNHIVVNGRSYFA